MGFCRMDPYQKKGSLSLELAPHFVLQHWHFSHFHEVVPKLPLKMAEKSRLSQWSPPHWNVSFSQLTIAGWMKDDPCCCYRMGFIIVHHVVWFGFSINFSVIGHFLGGHSVEMESGGPWELWHCWGLDDHRPCSGHMDFFWGGGQWKVREKWWEDIAF